MARNKIFIPISLERLNIEGSSYFFSPAKGVYTALAIIPGIIYVPYVATLTRGSGLGLILGLLTYGIVMSIFMRIVVFEELRWRRLFRDLEENKLSNHKYFWGIDRADDSGIIHYKYTGGHSLRKGVVIKLIRASKIGREESYDANYRAVFRMALHEIFRKGLDVDIYEGMEPKSVPYNIQMMLKKSKEIEDETTRKIALEHVKNLAIIAKTSKRVEATYVTLYFNNPRQFKDILDIAGDIQGIFADSKYFKVTNILNKTELDKYLAHTLHVKALPSDEGIVSVPDFSKYGEISRIFNEYGDEEWVEGSIVSPINTYKKPVRAKKDDILEEYTSDAQDYTEKQGYAPKLKNTIVDIDALYDTEIQLDKKHTNTKKEFDLSELEESLNKEQTSQNTNDYYEQPQEFKVGDSIEEDYKPQLSMSELRKKGSGKIKSEARNKIMEITDKLLSDSNDEFFEDMLMGPEEGWNNTSAKTSEAADFDTYFGDPKPTRYVEETPIIDDELELEFGVEETDVVKNKKDPDELVDLDSLLG